MNTFFKITFKNIAGVMSLAIFFLMASCQENLATNLGKEKTDFASQVFYNADVLQHDSGRITLKFKAPLVEKYDFVDTPYAEAKKGIYIEFFDKENPNTPGKLWANYAKMVEATGFYEAKGDVKIINPEGQTFTMQTLYWNKREKEIFTRDTVFITDTEGNILIGSHGMHAKDDLSSYSLYSTFGEANPDNLPDLKKD